MAAGGGAVRRRQWASGGAVRGRAVRAVKAARRFFAIVVPPRERGRRYLTAGEIMVYGLTLVTLGWLDQMGFWTWPTR